MTSYINENTSKDINIYSRNIEYNNNNNTYDNIKENININENIPLMKWSNIYVNKNIPAVKNHTIILYENILYIFGGYDGKANRSELFTFDTNTYKWSYPITYGTAPLSRNGHTATLINHSMWILGGWLGDGPLAANDLHTLDFKSMRWYKPSFTGEAPGPCNMHSADYADDLFVVFRGGDGRSYYNDVSVLDICRYTHRDTHRHTHSSNHTQRHTQ
eukprot:GHVR01001014.1.p1 GENE.GHVR01001014.1~~GHVR01001014.1.p1  ORF type:complete len:228 (+),score=77.45 GHVR01001014.1:35-685(+)